jgi:hypothetical protein
VPDIFFTGIENFLKRKFGSGKSDRIWNCCFGKINEGTVLKEHR